MQVHTELGYVFLEKVYENSLLILLRENGIEARAQVPIKVTFHDQIVGDIIADDLVVNSIILELKARDEISEAHPAQTLDYLKATGLKLVILLNFGRQRLESERLVL